MSVNVYPKSEARDLAESLTNLRNALLDAGFSEESVEKFIIAVTSV